MSYNDFLTGEYGNVMAKLFSTLKDGSIDKAAAILADEGEHLQQGSILAVLDELQAGEEMSQFCSNLLNAAKKANNERREPVIIANDEGLFCDAACFTENDISSIGSIVDTLLEAWNEMEEDEQTMAEKEEDEEDFDHTSLHIFMTLMTAFQTAICMLILGKGIGKAEDFVKAVIKRLEELEAAELRDSVLNESQGVLAGVIGEGWLDENNLQNDLMTLPYISELFKAAQEEYDDAMEEDGDLANYLESALEHMASNDNEITEEQKEFLRSMVMQLQDEEEEN
jgi:hypothetical protein